MQARTGRPKPSHTPSSLSRRNSLKKKKSWNIKNINKKNKAGKLNLQMRQALAFSLNMAGAIPDDVKSLDSDQDAYNGTYFRNTRGPIVVVAGLKNASKETLQELSADIGAMHQFDPPSEIYLDLDDSLKDNARNQVIKNTLKEVDNIMAPPGKEYRRELFRGFAKLRLVDSPEPLTANSSKITSSQIMSPIEFINTMGERPKASVRPDEVDKKPKPPTRYDAIVKVLEDYHAEIQQQGRLISRTPDQPDLSKTEFDAANQLIQDKGEELKTALRDYLENSSTFKVSRKTWNDKFGDKKYQTVDNLLQQVNKVYPDPGKKLKKPKPPQVNEILNTVRLNNLNRKYGPLQDSQIIGQGRLLGEGAQGQVFSKYFNTKNRPELPNNFEAGIKFGSDQASGEAEMSGIPLDDPQEAKRAVATYEVSRLLGLNVVPPTTFIMGINDKTGALELGQAMQRVSGTDGQRKARRKIPLDPIAYKAHINDPPGTSYPKIELEWDNNGNVVKGWPLTPLPVKVNFKSAVVQKDLADLQILDNIIGHADRHFGNLIFEGTGPDKITGVKGIDNDDTFGKGWVTKDNPRPGEMWSSKTPGLPPIIDAHTAISILEITQKDLEPLKTTFSTEEYSAILQRLQTVQETIQKRIAAGDLAVMPGQKLSTAEKIFLAAQGKLDDSKILNALPEWGNAKIYTAHLPPPTAPGAQPPATNSYLGEMIVMGEYEGFASWPNAT